MNERKNHQQDRIAALDQLVRDIAKNQKLESWTAFARTMSVPADMLPALMSGRVELLKLVTPRALSAEEAALMYDAIANLIETNALLQQHAQQTSQMVKQWGDAFKHLHSVGGRIEAFADFRTIADE